MIASSFQLVDERDFGLPPATIHRIVSASRGHRKAADPVRVRSGSTATSPGFGTTGPLSRRSLFVGRWRHPVWVLRIALTRGCGARREWPCEPSVHRSWLLYGRCIGYAEAANAADRLLAALPRGNAAVPLSVAVHRAIRPRLSAWPITECDGEKQGEASQRHSHACRSVANISTLSHRPIKTRAVSFRAVPKLAR